MYAKSSKQVTNNLKVRNSFTALKNQEFSKENEQQLKYNVLYINCEKKESSIDNTTLTKQYNYFKNMTTLAIKETSNTIPS